MIAPVLLVSPRVSAPVCIASFNPADVGTFAIRLDTGWLADGTLSIIYSVPNAQN